MSTVIGTDFHAPGQNYGAQGGQVGGGGGSVGVPGGRGPPQLGGIQSIGQAATGIPPGGPAGGQQAPPTQSSAPGVQSQQTQGPAPTTTPPVHTPSPQEMGKQGHLQTQQSPIVYMPQQTRPSSQNYYTGPRSQQPRNLSHRVGQGGSGTTQVVGIPGVAGGGGQQPTMYSHLASLPVQSTMYGIQPAIHPGPHQQPVFSMNSQMPLQFSGPPSRHPAHQSQFYAPPFQTPLLTSNMFGYTHGPAAQPNYFYHNSAINLRGTSANAVSVGAQHGGPLGNAQGATVVPQATIQQSTQQPQSMPQVGMPITSSDLYVGHNGGSANAANNTAKNRKPRRQKAILDIVDPKTGKNISEEIYEEEAATQSGESSSRETPQPQNNGAEVVADFAARVMKAATEESDTSTGSPVPANTSDNAAIAQNATQTLSNVQTNSNNDTSNRSNTETSASTSSTSTQNIANVASVYHIANTISNVAQIDSSRSTVKTDSKPLQLPAKEFQPRTEIKTVLFEETPQPAVPIVNKDNIPAQTASSAMVSQNAAVIGALATPVPAAIATETETKNSISSSGGSSASVTQTSSPFTAVPTSNVPEVPKPSVTAPSANPVPAREPFPNLYKTTSPPPRRKSQTHAHVQQQPQQQQQQQQASNIATESQQPQQQQQQQQAPASTTKDSNKDRKTREKSLNSRGATPTPTPTASHNLPDHHQKPNGDVLSDKPEPADAPPRNEIQPKPLDGKAMQKQKNKSKLKRDLNRKGAEKEGTEMDAFNVNTVPSAKPEMKQVDNKESSVTLKESNKDSAREVTKEIKEKDNHEIKKEKEITSTNIKPEKPVTTTEISQKESTPNSSLVIGNCQAKEITNAPSEVIEDNAKTSNVTNAQVRIVPNDVVDHAAVVKEDVDLEAIVAQKNEENSKASAVRPLIEEESDKIPIIEKNCEKEIAESVVNATTKPLELKYTYPDWQWSPLNKTGKKVYDREFLMKLQDDPSSKIKPANLPDLEIVLKDMTKIRTIADIRPFKEPNLSSRHDSLLPDFAKNSVHNRTMGPATRDMRSISKQGNKLYAKPGIKPFLSMSLREDVKLREAENAWKPMRVKPVNVTEEEAKTEALYKKFRSVLNKLTPQKFNTLIEQVRALTIDTHERLQGVINLVFEKAVDEPNFSLTYALMCKELGTMGTQNGPESSEDTSVSFKKLIITRCQREFEKNPIDDVWRSAKLKEIKESPDPDKKKELQASFEEEERRIRVKSVGNIRFIGELYKQGMLTAKIMHQCIQILLDQSDEDNLECLCKLLTTIGKGLEIKNSLNEEMEALWRGYFIKMQEIVSQKGQKKISSRIRFMLQDVIDLRANNWVPRRDDSNPKTIDQITKEAESERLDSQLNNTPLNTPRKDDRNNDRKRNRIGPTDEGGWSQAVGRTRQQTYSVETAKLKNKPPAMDDLQLGNRNMFQWKNNPSAMPRDSKTITPNKFACLDQMSMDQEKRAPLQLSGSRSIGPREYGGRSDYKSYYEGRSSRNGSHQMGGSSSYNKESSLLEVPRSQSVNMPPPSIKSIPQSTSSNHNKPPLSEEQFEKAFNSILKKYLKESNLGTAVEEIKDTFDNASLSKFVREGINYVLERSANDREQASRLFSRLISQNVISQQSFNTGFLEVLELVDDLIIDIPKIWTYLAEILCFIVEEDTTSLSAIKPIFAALRSQGYVGKLLGELLTKLSKDKGSKWAAEKWDQSEIKWNNIIDTDKENVDKIIKEHNLEFLTGNIQSAKNSNGNQLSLEQIHDQLTQLMKQTTNCNEIHGWIAANVGDRVKSPSFIRVLTTAILETSIELLNATTYKINSGTFSNLVVLIHRFVDANELLELHCLYTVQAYMNKLQHPSGILPGIVQQLYEYGIISSEGFLAWQSSKGPAEFEGHSIAMMMLTSFFTNLQEAEDASSVEEGSTSMTQDCC
ncbi:eukaryotic translation initiation factor 4 gamma 3-like isoform X2 [Prorops nasuta]|uniref:eukaryotic translation initiation factor 4 gamma 3-like isoform X2 n=1 Tax=Prorops nasuta TaxID=863751 RepID=UPI0034CF59C3